MSAASADDRSPAEIVREQALGEISDVLLNLEHTRTRAKKALQRVRKSGGEHNVELALTELIADLERTHKRFMHDTYYAGDTLRLL
ncbi:MAG: hypothetical protein CMF57_06935 [Leifsonia sp.]|nr:hypothetical protein [Leifsonia sp.]